MNFFVTFKGYSKYIKRTVAIAAPVIFENIMISVVSFVDTFMVGSLGASATAAVAINTPITWLMNSFSVMLAVGGIALVARYIGANDFKEANAVATQTMGAAFIFSTVLMVLMFFISGYVPKWLGAEPDVLPSASSYLRIYSFSIAVHFSGLIASNILRGTGNTKTPMYASLMANVINVLGNFLLIFPVREVAVFGFKLKIWGAGMGVSGAALATTLSFLVSGGFVIFILFRKNQILRLSPKGLFKFERRVLKNVLKIGVPAGIERISITTGQVFLQKIIASLGTVSVAAHYLAVTAESISYMPAYGFATSATTLVGHSLGAKEKDEAIVYSRINTYFGIAVGVLCGSLFVLFPHVLISFFTKDAAVIEQGSSALRIMGFVEPLFCLTIVVIGVLRGAGDTKLPLLAAVTGMWVVRLTSAWFFVYAMGLGLNGAWFGMAIDISVRSVILSIRYFKKKWVNIEIGK